jgi:hypothetical protein
MWVVLAWLMKENRWDVTKALHKLKKKRSIVCPNEVLTAYNTTQHNTTQHNTTQLRSLFISNHVFLQAFMWQLHQWQAMGSTLQGSSLAHKQYFNWKKSTMTFGFSMTASVCVGVRCACFAHRIAH